MTREEAINVLENPDVSIGVAARIGQDPEYWKKLKPALDMAISALRQHEQAFECTQYEQCEYNGNPVCHLPEKENCPHGLKVVEIDQVKPLTLDELRQMDGEPVWLVNQNGGHWVIMSGAYLWDNRKNAEYGKTWLAFRQKPEEGTV